MMSVAVVFYLSDTIAEIQRPVNFWRMLAERSAERFVDGVLVTSVSNLPNVWFVQFESPNAPAFPSYTWARCRSDNCCTCANRLRPKIKLVAIHNVVAAIYTDSSCVDGWFRSIGRWVYDEYQGYLERHHDHQEWTNANAQSTSTSTAIHVWKAFGNLGVATSSLTRTKAILIIVL